MRKVRGAVAYDAGWRVTYVIYSCAIGDEQVTATIVFDPNV